MTAVVKELLATIGRETAERRLPEATYRLQLHAGFTFRDAAGLVPYLRELGISHCYASPYLKARPGSTHGYDIIDHRVLNPEIGSEEDYNAWIEAMHAHGMGQILDMVPNHMGVVGNENAWWNDVLENGPSSPYAGYFDISWYASPRPQLHGRVLLPVLGDPYGKALESGQLRLEYAAGAFTICYFEHRFPVAPRSYGLILGRRLEELERRLPADDPALIEYQSILTAVKHLPRRTETDPDRVAERQREKEVIKRRLAALTQDSAVVREFLEETVALFNGKPGDPRSFDPLDELLDDQAYRLAFWRVAADEINYRRFFDINELAALSMERPEVFAATHELVLRLLAEGKVNGLRIDHPDGLYDPRQYLQRLQEAYMLARARHLFESRPEYRGLDWKEVEEDCKLQIANCKLPIVGGQGAARGRECAWPLYVVVEKILGTGEPLPDDWPTYGTSGYDFLNMVNGLFVDAANAPAFSRIYRDWIQDTTPFAEVVYQKKSLILRVALSSELHMLAHQLDRLAQKDRWSRDFTLTSLRHALREIIACFPVYRSYIDDAVHDSDRRYVERAVARAKAKNPAISASVFNYVRDMLLLKYPTSASEEDRAEQRRFVGKFQQVTAPVMAKGLEDTAFYVYNRLLSLNEVGGDPARFGLAPAVLHRYFQERQARWPWAFSALSTHDTKRSEDVRARLNALSELPEEWKECLDRWARLNGPHRSQVEEEGPAPDPNEEYFLYQTLLGAWPLEPYSAEEYAQFVERIQTYVMKALHEAKVHTSWINPNPAYDEAVQRFVARILDPEVSGPFLDDFRTFQRKISHFGLFNSLAQTLLKITAPGVPDTYQGTELWDFSLVDPDNRRPVDYECRQQMLGELKERVAAAGERLPPLARELTAAKEDGRIKLYVTWRALQCRNAYPGLFAVGDYLPLEAVGACSDQVFAFARRQGATWAVVAVPRLLTRLLSGPPELPLGREVWQDTLLLLPEIEPGRQLSNVFTGERLTAAERPGSSCLLLADVFANFPVALLLTQE
ncbi:MAG TPA: malto-oligosyltrehalose synthase [Gemmataceae bacterium]|nr:malto-oligosyltrehalose synthase [Gemmataceae bacterium]